MESLDDLVIARIVDYMGGPYFAVALRATCRAMRALIAPPEKCETHVMLRRGARLGRRDLCELAHAHGTWNYNGMLRDAAHAGRVDLCKLARKWAADDASDAFDAHERADIRAHHEHMLAHALHQGDYFGMRDVVGVLYYRGLFRNAARNGGREILDYVLEEFGNVGAYLGEMSIGSAEGGHFKFDKLIAVQDWRIYRDELIGAARGGYRASCEYILDGGSCDSHTMNKMLCAAARGGHRDICELAFARGATDPEKMLDGAARGGWRELCDIAIARGARNFSVMAVETARGGHRELCEYAVQLGSRDYNAILLAAARGGHIDVCEYARRLGARDFMGVARIAHRRAYVKLCKLSHKWRVSSGDA